MFLSSQHFGNKGACWNSGMGTMMSDKWVNYFTWTRTNQIRSWLMHSWNTFGAWMSHGHTWTHKVHHGLDLGEATTFPFIILFVISHGGYIQMPFCPRISKLKVSKFPKLGLLALWRAITCVELQFW
jgi:hypothetical protein